MQTIREIRRKANQLLENNWKEAILITLYSYGLSLGIEFFPTIFREIEWVFLFRFILSFLIYGLILSSTASYFELTQGGLLRARHMFHFYKKNLRIVVGLSIKLFFYGILWAILALLLSLLPLFIFGGLFSSFSVGSMLVMNILFPIFVLWIFLNTYTKYCFSDLLLIDGFAHSSSEAIAMSKGIAQEYNSARKKLYCSFAPFFILLFSAKSLLQYLFFYIGISLGEYEQVLLLAIQMLCLFYFIPRLQTSLCIFYLEIKKDKYNKLEKEEEKEEVSAI